MIDCLTAEEWGKFTDWLRSPYPAGFAGYLVARDKAIVSLLMFAGLRVGECSRLLISDLFEAGIPVGTLVIRAEIAKTGQERSIPLGLTAQECLAGFQARWSALTLREFDGFAFTSLHSTSRLTVRQIQRTVQTIALHVINRAIHPHVFRHTFATRLMRRANIRVVQELLGHECLTSTQVYTHPDPTDYRNAINSL